MRIILFLISIDLAICRLRYGPFGLYNDSTSNRLEIGPVATSNRLEIGPVAQVNDSTVVIYSQNSSSLCPPNKTGYEYFRVNIIPIFSLAAFLSTTFYFVYKLITSLRLLLVKCKLKQLRRDSTRMSVNTAPSTTLRSSGRIAEIDFCSLP